MCYVVQQNTKKTRCNRFACSVSGQATQLKLGNAPFQVVDFGTADGLGFIQILPQIVGKL